jgi:hypothetical protein
MQLCLGSRQILRANLLQDSAYFGLSLDAAQQQLDDLLRRTQAAFAEHAHRFEPIARSMMTHRLRDNIALLSA